MNVTTFHYTYVKAEGWDLMVWKDGKLVAVHTSLTAQERDEIMDSYSQEQDKRAWITSPKGEQGK